MVWPVQIIIFCSRQNRLTSEQHRIQSPCQSCSDLDALYRWHGWVGPVDPTALGHRGCLSLYPKVSNEQDDVVCVTHQSSGTCCTVRLSGALGIPESRNVLPLAFAWFPIHVYRSISVFTSKLLKSLSPLPTPLLCGQSPRANAYDNIYPDRPQSPPTWGKTL